MSEEIIYFKEIEDERDEGYDVYRYYIKKYKNGEYYVVVDVENVVHYTATSAHCFYCGKVCLKIKPEEVEEVRKLLEKDPELFEEEYGGRDGWEEDCDF